MEHFQSGDVSDSSPVIRIDTMHRCSIRTFYLLPFAAIFVAMFCHGYGKEPFREPGSDLNPPFFSTPESLYHSRERVIHELELRISQPPKVFDLPHYDSHLLHQYRENILMFALNNRHWLTGAGSDAVNGAKVFASLIVQEFTGTGATLAGSRPDADGHILTLAALSLTDETLHILQLIQSYLPEANIELLRTELDHGLKFIQTIVQEVIPDAYYNGLTTPALIRLQATLGSVLSPLMSSKKSVYAIDELRAEIDNVLTSARTHSYYPAMDIDPESIIINAKAIEITTSIQCFQWPWPVSNTAKKSSNARYLICKDLQEPRD